MKKFVLSVLLLFSLCINSFCQEVLNSMNASWQRVIPGELICEPQQTSYGFSLITDSRYLIAYSGTGTLLWDKPLKRGSKPFYTVLPDDFFAVVTNNGKRLSLLNPSGSEIWSWDQELQITEKPFPGRDGRFFVRNENAIWCYGINGIRKWFLETPALNSIPAQELPDGSIVVFLKQLYDGKTKGLRISPFGEIMEEILFSGEVYSTVSCDEGILLSFTNGLAGLFSLQNNKAKNKWILSNKSSTTKCTNKFVLSTDKSKVIFIVNNGSSYTINLINLSKGEIISSFEIIAPSGDTTCIYNNQGIFITDSKTAWFYNLNGIEIWSGTFPAKTKNSSWNYFTYTPDNYLIIFDTSWTANAFRTVQSLQKTDISISRKNYNSFYNINTMLFDNAYMPVKINEDFASEKRLNDISKGDYGKKEIEWISMLLSGLYAKQQFENPVKDNLGTKTQLNVFQKDAAGYELMLNQIPIFGTDTFVKLTASMLKNEKDKANIKVLLNGIILNGYDPDAEILNSLYLLSRRIPEKEDTILIEICDAIYSLCLFNGRPAFYAKGKEILSTFLYPKYSSKTRSYARTVFKKISDLDL